MAEISPSQNLTTLRLRHEVGWVSSYNSYYLTTLAEAMALKKKKDPVGDLINKLPPYLRNRYFLVLVAFTFFMVFIDRHDISTQFRLNSTVERLEGDLDRFDEMIDEAEAEKLDMETNRETFAREGYYMQKDDEDVFIIVEEDEE